MKLGFIAVLVLGITTITIAQDTTRSSSWKEYVYPEHGFAITLPSDPHPHASSQMRNGTVYLLQLSNGSSFALHTMEANDKCVEAVRSQSDIYAKHKTDATTRSNGFKPISFREVAGAGYAGVEFTQQLPSGRINYERWICGSQRLYVLGSNWDPSESEPKELRRIVDSFRIITRN